MSNYIMKKIDERINNNIINNGNSIENIVADKEKITLDGIIIKSFALLALSLVTGYIGWVLPNSALAILAIFTGLISGIFISIKPLLASTLAPLYGLSLGYVLGYISRYFEATYPGIVINATGVTVTIFITLLTLYAKRIVRVTNKMRSIITVSTIGIFLYYIINLLSVVIFKNTSMPLITDNSLVGIGFTLFVAIIASYNFFLDFDRIENAIKNQVDQRYEWSLSAALLATFIWVYIEILRLLSKLRSRN